MSTTEPLVEPVPLVDARFAKQFVTACAATPLLMLGLDAWRGTLGINAVNYLIRTTGMVGLVFLSLSLLITPLVRLTGLRWLVATRRNFGLAGFWYILGHFVIFFLYDRAASIGSTLEEIIERQYLWFGTAALVIMIPLAITSTDGMITRLGPRRWKLLHRTAYLAVLGGVIHYFLLVKSDTTQPLVFGAIFGGLMAYRVGATLVDRRRTALRRARPRRFWSGQLRVDQIIPETADVKTFRLVMPDGAPLPFTHVAGQYLTITLPVGRRRYTIASSPIQRTYCEISVKRAGVASGYLHDTLKPGDLVSIGAPGGTFVFAGDEAERVILVAGGVGITPAMSVVRSLTDRAWDGAIYLLFSVRTKADVIFAKELADLEARFPNLHVKLVYSSESGHLTADAIAAFVPDFTRGPVLMCGPLAMMTALRAGLVARGIPNAEILEEEFTSPTTRALAPADASEPAAAIAAPVDAMLSFQSSGTTIQVPAGLTILDAAEDAGVDIPSDCRSGVCGQCKCKLVTGTVAMAAHDALSKSDRAAGLILACQARPTSADVTVDI